MGRFWPHLRISDWSSLVGEISIGGCIEALSLLLASDCSFAPTHFQSWQMSSLADEFTN